MVTTAYSLQRGPLVPDHPVVSVCILMLEGTSHARRCLESLRRPDGNPSNMELVVVANGTGPEELALLEDQEDLLLITSPHNMGFAGGCNLAAALAKGQFLVFLNDDSVVESGCIAALLDVALADSMVGAVGARIHSADGRLQEAGSVLWRDGSAVHVGEGLEASDDDYGESRDVDYASANGLLVTRTAWERVGGFDERFYPAYYEDVDLCLSLITSGFRVRYEPRARVVHLGSQSTSPALRGFLLARNQARLVEKWGPTLNQFDPRPPQDAGPVFDEAVTHAVRQAIIAARRRRIGSVPESARQREMVEDVAAAAERLESEYRSYLERAVVDDRERIRTLEQYIEARTSVRLKRWVARRIPARWRGSDGSRSVDRTEHAA